MPSTDEQASPWLTRKPRSELRHWSTYDPVDEWYRDYHGYVPVDAALGLRRLIRETGMSFPDAYRTLLGAGKIIHIDPSDDIEPPAAGPGPASGDGVAPVSWTG